MDTPVASPCRGSCGPENQMSQVDKVVANVALSGQRTESAPSHRTAGILG